METFSALLAFCAGNPSITGEFPAQRPVTQSVDVFFDLSQINDWVNNRDAGDMWCHRTHYDVIVMIIQQMTMSFGIGWTEVQCYHTLSCYGHII